MSCLRRTPPATRWCDTRARYRPIHRFSANRHRRAGDSSLDVLRRLAGRRAAGSAAPALEDEVAHRYPRRADGRVRLAEEQIGIVGGYLDHVVAQAARDVQRPIAALAVVEQEGV